MPVICNSPGGDGITCNSSGDDGMIRSIIHSKVAILPSWDCCVNSKIALSLQDGTPPGLGTVTNVPSDLTTGCITVHWDSGRANSYRMGVGGCYDVELA